MKNRNKKILNNRKRYQVFQDFYIIFPILKKLNNINKIVLKRVFLNVEI